MLCINQLPYIYTIHVPFAILSHFQYMNPSFSCSYAPDEFGTLGVYVAAEPLSPERNYFEIEINDIGVDSSICVGLVSAKHPLDQYPGWIPDSIGFHTGDGT